MKTIYKALLEQVKPMFDNDILRWFDWDKGQLKKKDETGRYPVAYPCALVRIGMPSTTDITDTTQDCEATITVTLAFDPLSYGRTAENAPEEIRGQGLEPYDVVAKIYARLQAYTGDNLFDPLRRKSQGELIHPDLFVYQLVFETSFEDRTADG